VLALALGSLVTALPASASTGAAVPPAASPADFGNALVTDSLNPGGVKVPDEILTCATSQIAIGGTEAVAIPVGCLTEYNNEWVKVTWSGTGVSTELTQQADGNFVLYVGNGKVWSTLTYLGGNGNPNGPGCFAHFQTDGNLVVSNCAGAAIWNSVTYNNPNAVLALQADGNLVIYANSAGTPLWNTQTYS
jgi:hypothetical protein